MGSGESEKLVVERRWSFLKWEIEQWRRKETEVRCGEWSCWFWPVSKAPLLLFLLLELTMKVSSYSGSPSFLSFSLEKRFEFYCSLFSFLLRYLLQFYSKLLFETLFVLIFPCFPPSFMVLLISIFGMSCHGIWIFSSWITRSIIVVAMKTVRYEMEFTRLTYHILPWNSGCLNGHKECPPWPIQRSGLGHELCGSLWVEDGDLQLRWLCFCPVSLFKKLKTWCVFQFSDTGEYFSYDCFFLNSGFPSQGLSGTLSPGIANLTYLQSV